MMLAIQQSHWQATEQDLRWAKTPGHYIIDIHDADYPALLKEITHPPDVLYVRGDKAVLQCQQFAMVGARNATPAGLRDAEAFASHLAQAGFVITSGLALGIDGAAHRGALNAKGRTIAVMGTGQLHLYPRQHKGLADQIVANGGAIVSEFPLDMGPQPYNFPRRNRIISGMSIGVLIVEAALKSGSLTTAKHALEQNREVFAIPGSIHSPQSRGCHQLIRQGAKLVESSADILEELGGFLQLEFPGSRLSSGRRVAAEQRLAVGGDGVPGVVPAKAGIQPEIDSKQAKLLAKIDYATTPLDVIVLRTGLTVSEVSSILLSLELENYIEAVAGGFVRVR